MDKDDNYTISDEDMQLMEGLFGMWSRNKPQPAPQDQAKSDIKDDLPNTTSISLDHFKDNDELISFIAFISNLHNISKVQDKKHIILVFRKYRELLDILMIAFPYIKTKSREFGLVVPKLVQENKQFRDKVKDLFKE